MHSICVRCINYANFAYNVGEEQLCSVHHSLRRNTYDHNKLLQQKDRSCNRVKTCVGKKRRHRYTKRTVGIMSSWNCPDVRTFTTA